MNHDDQQRLQGGIDSYLKGHIEKIECGRPDPLGDQDILSLMQMCVGRVLMKFARQRQSVTLAVAEASADDMRHIYDWLLAATLREEAWLDRRDDKGRPLKLMKFGTIQQIVHEADKAMARHRSEGFRVPAGEGAKIVHELGEGWTIVRLTTPEALDREGSVMGHCVGQGAYDSSVFTNFTGIYSLRDAFGKSHLTIEIDNVGDVVRQIKGKQNKAPKAEYMRKLMGWPRMAKMTVDPSELPVGFGYDKKKGVVELASLKRGDVFEGNIGILLNDHGDVTFPVPSGVTVYGNVTITGYKAERLGQVGDAMEMRWPKLIVPEGVFVNGYVRLDSVTLAGFSLGGSRLVIRNSTVSKLDDVRFDTIQFAGTRFSDRALEGTIFKGVVEMQDCRDVVFHGSTEIGDNLLVAGCRTLPDHTAKPLEFADGFKMRGRLHVLKSDITFSGECDIYDDMALIETMVATMPSRLAVAGNLHLEKLVMDRWPELLDVTGNIDEVDIVTRLQPRPAPSLG